MARSIFQAIVFLTASSVAGFSASAPSGNRTASVENQSSTIIRESKVHAIGGVRMNVGNEGTFASQNRISTDDPVIDLSYGGYPAFEFPAKSRGQHSFTGGLWVGGLRSTDTLVSRSTGLWSNALVDFNSLTHITSHYDSSRGHQWYESLYYDTIPYDSSSRPWFNPLGLEIRETSHAFASPPYDQFIILEYLIRNISGSVIQKPSVGFFTDCDVYNDNVSGQIESRTGDDLSGYLPAHGIAYSMDNNGDPRWDTAWARTSIRSAMGIALINADPLPSCTSFNWFATDYNNVGWGPSHQSTSYSNLRTPTYTGEIYAMMCNGELDYDQIYAMVDNSASGWNPPAPYWAARSIADGLDTRYVLSYSFPDLAPQDSIRIVITVAAGDSVHQAPADFAGYFDPAQPDRFYDRLDFTDLIRSVDLARYAWSHKCDLVGAAPTSLSVIPVGDDAVRCDWTPAPYHGVTGYRLMKRETGEAEWDTIASTSASLTEFVDHGLRPGVNYEYAVASVNPSGIAGPHSRPLQIAVGYPRHAPVLIGRNTPSAVGLHWIIPDSTADFAPYKWINIQRRNASDLWGEFGADADYRVPLIERQWNNLLDPASAPILPDQFGMTTFDFVDNEVVHAAVYSYRVSLTNALGLDGPWSNSVKVVPMRAQFDGIVLLRTKGDFRSLIDGAASTEFYTQWAEKMGFRIWTANETFPLLRILGSYRCAVVVMEDIYAQMPQASALAELATYIANGGRVVLIARNHASENSGNRPQPLLERFLGVSRAYLEIPWEPHSWYTLPRNYVVAGFTRAHPVEPNYPQIEGDSAVAWSNEYWMAAAGNVANIYDAGFVPAIGAVDSLVPGTDILYTYRSAYDTSFFHNKPIAVRRITDSSAAILFNFPLSLMKHEQAWQALSQAVADLGIDTTNTWTSSTSPTRAMLDWLYGRSTNDPSSDWDLNQDGIIDMRDVVKSLDR